MYDSSDLRFTKEAGGSMVMQVVKNLFLVSIVILSMLLLLFINSSTVYGFDNRNCVKESDYYEYCKGGPVHEAITREALSFLKKEVLEGKNVGDHKYNKKDPDTGIVDQHADIDVKQALGGSEWHFDNCRFKESTENIRKIYEEVITFLNPDDPNRMENLIKARIKFGQLLHTVQDFYSHSNWVETGVQELLDSNYDNWNLIKPYELRQGVVVIQGENRNIPDGIEIGITNNTEGIIVKVTVKKQVGNLSPGIYPGLISGEIRIKIGSGTEIRLIDDCPDTLTDTGMMSHDILNKDTPSRLNFEAACNLAVLQTQHEWKRLIHMIEVRYPGQGKDILFRNWVENSVAAEASDSGTCPIKATQTNLMPPTNLRVHTGISP